MPNSYLALLVDGGVRPRDIQSLNTSLHHLDILKRQIILFFVVKEKWIINYEFETYIL